MALLWKKFVGSSEGESSADHSESESSERLKTASLKKHPSLPNMKTDIVSSGSVSPEMSHINNFDHSDAGKRSARYANDPVMNDWSELIQKRAANVFHPDFGHFEPPALGIKMTATETKPGLEVTEDGGIIREKPRIKMPIRSMSLQGISIPEERASSPPVESAMSEESSAHEAGADSDAITPEISEFTTPNTTPQPESAAESEDPLEAEARKVREQELQRQDHELNRRRSIERHKARKAKAKKQTTEVEEALKEIRHTERRHRKLERRKNKEESLKHSGSEQWLIEEQEFLKNRAEQEAAKEAARLKAKEEKRKRKEAKQAEKEKEAKEKKKELQRQRVRELERQREREWEQMRQKEEKMRQRREKQRQREEAEQEFIRRQKEIEQERKRQLKEAEQERKRLAEEVERERLRHREETSRQRQRRVQEAEEEERNRRKGRRSRGREVEESQDESREGSSRARHRHDAEARAERERIREQRATERAIRQVQEAEAAERAARRAERRRRRALEATHGGPPPLDEYSAFDEDIPPYREKLHKHLDLVAYDERFSPILRVNRHLVNGEYDLMKAISQLADSNLLPKTTDLWNISHVDDRDYDNMIPVLIPESSYYGSELTGFVTPENRSLVS